MCVFFVAAPIKTLFFSTFFSTLLFLYAYSTAIRTHRSALCHTYLQCFTVTVQPARRMPPGSFHACNGEKYEPVFLFLQFCECVLVRVRTTDSLPRTFTKLSLFCPYGLVCQAFSGTWEEPGRKIGAEVKKSLVKNRQKYKSVVLLFAEELPSGYKYNIWGCQRLPWSTDCNKGVFVWARWTHIPDICHTRPRAKYFQTVFTYSHTGGEDRAISHSRNLTYVWILASA